MATKISALFIVINLLFIQPDILVAQTWNIDHNLSFGLNLSYFNYQEIFDLHDTRMFPANYTISGTPKSEEYGTTPIFNGKYTFLSPVVPVYVNCEYSYGSSKDTYDGSYQTEPEINGNDTMLVIKPLKTSKDNSFTRFQLQTGYNRHFHAFSFVPFIGYEFNRWYRKLDQTTETYHWHYLPLGIAAYYHASNRLHIGFSAQYNVMIQGNMQIEMPLLQLLGANAQIPAVNLGNRNGWRVSLPVSISTKTGTAALEITPWYEFRAFGISNKDSMMISSSDFYSQQTVSVPFIEPASRHYAYGVQGNICISMGWLHYLITTPPANTKAAANNKNPE